MAKKKRASKPIVILKHKLLADLKRVCGPTVTWPGHCARISHAALKCGVRGRSVHGMWNGPVHKDSIFAGKPFSQHEWIKLPDGQVCDPTRWVFEGKKPYIYVGPSDYYDEGANALRAMIRLPAPKWDPEEEQFYFDGSSECWNFIERKLGLDREVVNDDYEPGHIDRSQLFWLANAGYEELGEHVREIYEFLDSKGLEAAVPIDNWRRMEAESV